MVFHGLVCLWYSGQRTSVKCAEVASNYKAGGVVYLKSPACFCFVLFLFCLFCLFVLFFFVRVLIFCIVFVFCFCFCFVCFCLCFVFVPVFVLFFALILLFHFYSHCGVEEEHRPTVFNRYDKDV